MHPKAIEGSIKTKLVFAVLFIVNMLPTQPKIPTTLNANENPPTAQAILFRFSFLNFVIFTLLFHDVFMSVLVIF